jgi:hypothetical protein
MGNIVRRVVANSIEQSDDQATIVLPSRSHRSDGIFVESALSLGIEPFLRITWNVLPTYWVKGFTLMIFRSMTGFSPEKYPDDLNRHGQLIIETAQDDSYTTQPEEGTHYYTFLLHKQGFLGLSEKLAILRFSETVPSAKVGIGRIKDQIELQSMLRRHALDDIEHEAKLLEAELRLIHSQKSLDAARGAASRKASSRDEVVEKEMATIDAILETFVAKRQKLKELKRDPRFKKLSPAEREAVVDAIEQRLDAAEISARREMRGS